MFNRSSWTRASSRSINAFAEPERGQPCNACGDQCPGLALHRWRLFLQELLVSICAVEGMSMDYTSCSAYTESSLF
ncbi:hypothetical protein XELAEV_18024133mg [Xenopus laevis]|uniref:Uncharacterized protein n=1 Tax=Xenopus laevis TaxID=8355 RepID=A0A974D6B5_XENLA|nr:hypothetical protein XELAEV_18024133mg [Xenopus laevis]